MSIPLPRPPTNKTIISYPLTAYDIAPEYLKSAKEAYADILKKMCDKLENNIQTSLKQLLECASLTKEVYMQALDRFSGSHPLFSKESLQTHVLTTSIQQHLKYGEQTWTFNMSLILGPVPCIFC